MNPVEKTSQFLIYLLILSVTNIFGIFNVLETYRIPGVGKPSDFILVALIILTIFSFLNRFPGRLSKEYSVIVKSNLLILCYVFFLVLYTAYISRIESFNYSLRIASHFFYYSSFIFPLFLIKQEKYFYKFINFLRLGGIITGIIAIVSNIFGFSITSAVVSAEEGGFVRVYLPAFFNYFVVTFWLIQFLSRYKMQIKIHYIEMTINLLGILLFLGRTRIIVLLFLISFVFMFLTKGATRKNKVLIVIPSLVAGALLFLELFKFPVETITQRFSTGYQQLFNPYTALTGRWQLICLGFNIFLENPLFGTGFVHSTSPYYNLYLVSSTGRALTNSVDFGLVSILYTTGITGFLIILNFIIRLLLRLKHIITDMRDSKILTDKFAFGVTIFAIILFVFFIEQIAGNEFANRIMAVDLLSAGYAINFLGMKNS